MNKKTFMLWTRRLLTSALGLASLYAFAITPRKVTVPLFANSASSSSDGLSLLNGSNVAVTYSVTCFGKNGTQLFSKSGLVLNAKAKAVHGRGILCANDVAGGTGSGGTFAGEMVTCGSPPQSQAAAQCGTGYSLCTRAQMIANKGTVTYASGWVSDLGEFPTLHFGNGSFWSSASVTFLAGSINSTEYCASDSSGTDAINYCSPGYPSTPSFCCKNAGFTNEPVAHSCSVEIESSTPQGGYLQSPQFKGGAAF